MHTKQAVLALLFAGANAKMHSLESQQAELIVKGLLEGAIQAEGLDDIEHCLADAKEVVADAEIAIADFEKKDAKDVIAGVKELAELLIVAKNAVKDCNFKGDISKLEKMVAALSNPASFAYHVGRDLVINGRSIYKEVDTAIGDYHKQDWEGFGFNCGEAAAKAILGAEPVTSEAGQKFATVLQGVMKAFGAVDINVPALMACIGDEKNAFLILEKAYTEAEAAKTDHNSKEAISAVILAVAGLMQAKKGLVACEAIKPSSWDMQGFLKSEQLMSNPTKFFEVHGADVLINGVSIFKDINSAVKSWKSGDFEKFGESTGDIMKLASHVKKVETEKSVDNKDVASFMQGFFDATSIGHINFTSLLECIYVVDQDAQILDSIVTVLEDAVKTKNGQEAIEALIGAATLVKQVEQTIPICKSINQSSLDWTLYHEIMATIEDKKYEVIEENIIMNGKVINKEVGETLNAWRSGDFKEFGENLGLTLRATCAPRDGLFMF